MSVNRRRHLFSVFEPTYIRLRIAFGLTTERHRVVLGHDDVLRVLNDHGRRTINWNKKKEFWLHTLKVKSSKNLVTGFFSISSCCFFVNCFTKMEFRYRNGQMMSFSLIYHWVILALMKQKGNLTFGLGSFMVSRKLFYFIQIWYSFHKVNSTFKLHLCLDCKTL